MEQLAFELKEEMRKFNQEVDTFVDENNNALQQIEDTHEFHTQKAEGMQQLSCIPPVLSLFT